MRAREGSWREKSIFQSQKKSARENLHWETHTQKNPAKSLIRKFKQFSSETLFHARFSF